jgi:hypothetical protein
MSAEVFSPQSGRFEGDGSLGTARHKHDAIKLADGSPRQRATLHLGLED